MLLSIMRLVSVVTLLPMPSDTPPAQRIPAPPPRELRAVDDVVLTARLADGSRAPSNLVLPDLVNRQQVFEFLRANYPDTSAGVPPTTIPVAWVYIDETGVTHYPELIVSSGAASFDSLAVGMVRRARFVPAKVEFAIVPVWVMVPVQLTGAALSEARRRPPDASGPRFVPYTKKPELSNRDQVARALVREYPPELRAQGRGGTIQMWLHINEEGDVADARVRAGSGYPEMDAAAVRVARIMRFTPAENRGVKAAVWISVPIVFATR